MSLTAIATKDGTVYLATNGIWRHRCKRVGDVELSEDWRFCPWCGMGLTNRKKAIARLDLRIVQAEYDERALEKDSC